MEPSAPEPEIGEVEEGYPRLEEGEDAPPNTAASGDQTLETGEKTGVSKDRMEPRNQKRIWFLVAKIAIAVVALGVSVYFFYLAASEYDEERHRFPEVQLGYALNVSQIPVQCPSLFCTDTPCSLGMPDCSLVEGNGQCCHNGVACGVSSAECTRIELDFFTDKHPTSVLEYAVDCPTSQCVASWLSTFAVRGFAVCVRDDKTVVKFKECPYETITPDGTKLGFTFAAVVISSLLFFITFFQLNEELEKRKKQTQ